MPTINLSHRIRLRPTARQERLFRKAVGVARFAWNWALAEWDRQYKAGEKPNEAALRKQLNAIKHKQFPWMLEVSKTVQQTAIQNLGKAFLNFFEGRAERPTFKKKGRCRDSARLDNGPGTFRCIGRRISLAKIGWVKMREELRFQGKPLSATISCVAGKWYVSVNVQIEHAVPPRENQARAVGIDLGVTTAATLSTGEKLPGPKALAVKLDKLRRLSRKHSRKAKGSANRRKSAMRLARLHDRISCVRKDWLHKLTTRIVRENDRIGIEDLNVKGMTANRRLARVISDVGMFEFRRQLTYKAELYGAEVVVADRLYPSSKTCSRCGVIVETLPLSVRDWTCPCGTTHDRDVNAAKNLCRLAETTDSSSGSNACGDGSSGRGRKASVKLPSRKQESNRVRFADAT